MYKVALLSVPFDNSYDNVVRAISREQQYAMFNIDALLTDKPEINFKISNLIKTSVVIRVEDENVFGYNYLIVKDTDKPRYEGVYFYFITNTTFDNGNQYIFDVELDVYQTYSPYCSFTPSFIRRAHADRFKSIGGGLYTFVNNIDSYLYVEEPYTFNQALVTNKQIKFGLPNPTIPALIPQQVNDWIKKNVKFWEIFVYDDNGTKGGYDLPVYKIGSTFVSANINLGVDFRLNYLCLVVPHFNSEGKYIYTRYDDKLFVMNDTIINAKSLLPSANLVARVLSPVCPIDSYIFRNATVTEDILTVPASGLPNGPNYTLFQDLGVLNVGVYKYSAPTAIYTVDDILSFNSNRDLTTPVSADYIKSASNDMILNPKLYLSNVRKFRLTDGFNYKDYIPLAFTNFDNPKITALKSFSMSDIAMYIYIDGLSLDNIYYNANSNYEGLNSIQDGQMLFNRDQIDVFLANNKNFIAQAITQQTGNIAKAAVSTSPTAIANSVVGGVTSALDTYFTVDNIANSPDQIACSKLNILQAMNISNLRPIFKYYAATPQDMYRLHSYTHKYGFTTNIIDDPKYYTTNRKVFCYIEADIDSVVSTISIPNYVRDAIKRIYKKGVRVWANLSVYNNYNLPNYEVSL